MWAASPHNGCALMGGKARAESFWEGFSFFFPSSGGEAVGLGGWLGWPWRCGEAKRWRWRGRLGWRGGGKGFTALLSGDQFMGIQPSARYSLNASSGGMQQHQLECVRR